MHPLRSGKTLLFACLAAGVLAGCQAAAATTPTASPFPATATLAATATPAPSATVTASQTPACLEQQGSLEQSSYPSGTLGRGVPLWVYVPPCYTQSEKPVPVVYFFHGKPYDQSHWVNLDLIQLYENGLQQGRWTRALLVFPNLPEPLFSRSDGGPGSYEQEFMEEVVPTIESRYPGGPTPAAQSLAGISRGGIWSLEIGFKNASQFEGVAALSPSLAVNYPRSAYDPFQLAKEAAHHPDEVLLLAGHDDWARNQTEQLAQILTEAGAHVDLEIVEGSHLDPTWQRALPLVLDFLLHG